MDCSRPAAKGTELVLFLEFIMLSVYWLLDFLFQSFEDLHKLWYVLYKERNLLLTTKQKLRRTQRPVIAADEFRYVKVKRSMAGIKHVMDERKKIDKILGVSSSIPLSYSENIASARDANGKV